MCAMTESFRESNRDGHRRSRKEDDPRADSRFLPGCRYGDSLRALLTMQVTCAAFALVPGCIREKERERREGGGEKSDR